TAGASSTAAIGCSGGADGSAGFAVRLRAVAAVSVRFGLIGCVGGVEGITSLLVGATACHPWYRSATAAPHIRDRATTKERHLWQRNSYAHAARTAGSFLLTQRFASSVKASWAQVENSRCSRVRRWLAPT